MYMERETKGVRDGISSQCSGMVWFLGALGAAVYFIQSAETFWQGVLGILKALVWPAYLVYHFLQSFGL